MKAEVIKSFLLTIQSATYEALEAFENEETEVEAPKAKAGRKPKAKKEEPEESEDDGGDDMGFDTGSDSDDGDVDAPTVDDVREAFKNFVTKHKDIKAGREAAMKILNKFKAKKIDDLDESDFAEAIELTTKKK